MSILLSRIDDRLIHGQVVVGWGGPLRIRRFILVDDEVRASGWEQELYRTTVPPDVVVEFASVEEARAELRRWNDDATPSMLIVGAIETVAALLQGQDDLSLLPTVNLGGVHAGPGRARLLRYLFLSDEERSVLDALAEQGVRIEAQDLPGSRPIPWGELS